MIKRILSLLMTMAMVAMVWGFQASAQEDAVKQHWKLGVESLRNGDKAGALDHFQQAVQAGETAQPPLTAGSPAMADAHYGVAYTLMVSGKIMDAIPVAENLVTQAPSNMEARYLLGVLLTRSATADGVKRGMEVLGQMAQESDGDIKTIATRGAGRLGLNFSSAHYAAGSGSAANGIMMAAISGAGNTPGESAEENNMIAYASGVYMVASGNAEGAVSTLSAINTSNSEFKLANGVSIKQVLGGAYYQASLDSLVKGAAGADRALALLDELTNLEGDGVADVHHAKAQAYELKGDKASAKKHYDAIKDIDPAYHKRVAPATGA